MKTKKGFTLLEILLVIATIGILAAIVIVAINPNRQLGSARNVQRLSGMFQLISAGGQYSVDNNGNFPPDLESMSIGEVRMICRDGVVQSTCQSEGLVFLGDLVPGYIAAIPEDPQAQGNETGFLVYRANEENYGLIAINSENNDIKVVGAYPGGLEAVPDGLIHYYDGEEQSLDRSKGQANMSWVGTESYVSAGIGNVNFSNGRAFDFDGSSYLTTGQPDLNDIDDFTTAGWFRTNAISERTAIWGQNDVVEICFGSDQSFGLWNGETGVYSVIDENDIGVDFDDGTWHHLAFTASLNEVRVYVDGVDVSSFLNEYSYGAVYSSSYPFTIGARSCDGDGVDFTGQIDDVRIYDRILSEEEIQILYEN